MLFCVGIRSGGVNCSAGRDAGILHPFRPFGLFRYPRITEPKGPHTAVKARRIHPLTSLHPVNRSRLSVELRPHLSFDIRSASSQYANENAGLGGQRKRCQFRMSGLNA